MPGSDAIEAVLVRYHRDEIALEEAGGMIVEALDRRVAELEGALTRMVDAEQGYPWFQAVARAALDDA